MVMLAETVVPEEATMPAPDGVARPGAARWHGRNMVTLR